MPLPGRDGSKRGPVGLAVPATGAASAWTPSHLQLSSPASTTEHEELGDLEIPLPQDTSWSPRWVPDAHHLEEAVENVPCVAKAGQHPWEVQHQGIVLLGEQSQTGWAEQTNNQTKNNRSGTRV